MKGFMSFGYSFFLTILFPGFIASLIIFPFLLKGYNLISFYFNLPQIDLLKEFIWVISATTICLGILLSLLDDIIYRIYEGMIIWPQCIRRSLTDHLNKRIQSKKKEADNIRDVDSIRYRKIWFWLRGFPLNASGEPHATVPTKLGNIIQQYEQYSASRYGMDAVFYWYRVWLTLENDRRKEIANALAQSDSIIYISFVFLATSAVYFIIWILWIFDFPLGPFIDKRYLIEAIKGDKVLLDNLHFVWGGLLICFYLFYLISLWIHRRNGEVFKSVFDVFRNRLSGLLGEFDENERRKWEDRFSYLQYLAIKCPRCGRRHFYKTECPRCGLSGS